MYEAKLYTLWFIYTDKDSNNVLMCSISNMRFSNTTFTCGYFTAQWNSFHPLIADVSKIILNMETTRLYIVLKKLVMVLLLI